MVREDTFIRLFVRHETELRGFAISLVPFVDDARDVLQDACVAMWRRIDTLRDEEGFLPWAFTFIRLTALNKIRKDQRSRLVFSEALMELNAEEAGAESERAQAELQSLRQCVQDLPPNQLSLVRRYYGNTKVRMEELSREMNRPVAGLYKAMERIRATLRDCIERRMTEAGF